MFGMAKKIDIEAHLRLAEIMNIFYDDEQRLQFTPDYPQLSQKKSHLVFIHDDMMQTQQNHKLVVDGSLSGFYPFTYGYTTRRFSFVKKELALKSFPVALDLRDTSELPAFMANTSRIRGEIYAVRPQTLIDLDTHRQNGVQFQRTRVNINIGTRKLRRHNRNEKAGHPNVEYVLGKEEMFSQQCWMYIGREDYWKDQLEAGFFDFKPIDIIEEDRLWIREYYQYSRVR